ncbi:hypothetical protein PS662_01354 [Pseudomonas fluorescens]|uniref:Uncharacterized protein n=1 Tax=Pseudomonas fluorescens TaxID=294 RepID=A0A5E6R2V5_PSEFL|nr:hypothetical protein [Pseudomonas fluorescens]VVM61964.1 hypothetical protein PS662_01354 [Pseudomonas fluorescens]
MNFSSPILPQFPPLNTDQPAVIELSKLRDCLIVRVPEPNDIPPNWDAYPIFGADPDEPDWRGVEEPTGYWDDAIEDMVKRTGIELKIPKADLERYQGRKVELRYKFADESSLEPCSEPLLILIEP